jgi:hypothetical protein
MMGDTEFIEACWDDTVVLLVDPTIEADRRMRALMMCVGTATALDREVTMMSTIMEWALSWRHTATPEQAEEMNAILAESLAFAARMEQA